MAKKASVLSVLQQLVERGPTFTSTDEFEVEKGMLKRFAIAIGDPNPLYYDEEFARTTAYGGIIAPPTFLFEWNHHEHHFYSKERLLGFFRSVEHPIRKAGEIWPANIYDFRTVVGGHEYEIIQPVRPGDIISTESRVTQVYEKQGKSGQLIFMVTETTYYNQKKNMLGKAKNFTIFLPVKGL